MTTFNRDKAHDKIDKPPFEITDTGWSEWTKNGVPLRNDTITYRVYNDDGSMTRRIWIRESLHKDGES